MTPFLSIIIACWNEPEHLADTLQSIEDTANGFPIEIIIVDDFSDKLFDWPALSSRNVFPLSGLYNPTRSGHAFCRQRGSEVARGEWLLFTDAHMIFELGWFEAFKIQVPHHNSKTLFCGPYVFSRAEWEADRHPPDLFYGARLYYWERTGSALDVIGYKPLGGSPIDPDWSYEVPGIIGANYFIRKDWFHHIDGLKHFFGWSCMDEFMLSVKTWLFGGSVRIIPDVRLRHILHPTGQGANGYGKTMTKADLIFNKLSGAFQLFSKEIYAAFLSALPRDDKPAIDLALRRIEGRRPGLEQANAYLTRHAERSHDWLCNRFQILHPGDIGAAQYLAP